MKYSVSSILVPGSELPFEWVGHALVNGQHRMCGAWTVDSAVPHQFRLRYHVSTVWWATPGVRSATVQMRDHGWAELRSWIHLKIKRGYKPAEQVQLDEIWPGFATDFMNALVMHQLRKSGDANGDS